jgi:hypothetical protein
MPIPESSNVLAILRGTATARNAQTTDPMRFIWISTASRVFVLAINRNPEYGTIEQLQLQLIRAMGWEMARENTI